MPVYFGYTVRYTISKKKQGRYGDVIERGDGMYYCVFQRVSPTLAFPIYTADSPAPAYRYISELESIGLRDGSYEPEKYFVGEIEVTW